MWKESLLFHVLVAYRAFEAYDWTVCLFLVNVLLIIFALKIALTISVGCLFKRAAYKRAAYLSGLLISGCLFKRAARKQPAYKQPAYRIHSRKQPAYA